jgi:hypothetical protein
MFLFACIVVTNYLHVVPDGGSFVAAKGITTQASGTVILAAAVVVIGCNQPDAPALNPIPGKPPAQTCKPESVWEPDPKLMARLSEPVTFDSYQMTVPKDFVRVEWSSKKPDPINVFSWRGPPGEDFRPPALVVMVDSGKKAVEESKQDLRKALVNYTAGMANTWAGVVIKREQAETGTLGGIEFARLKWSGATREGIRVSGLVYAGVDDARAINIMAVNFGPHSDEANKVMEAAVTTFKRQ